MKRKVTVIGSGFSSISAACYLAKGGYEVDVFEKNDQLGGRARQFSRDGFKFDMGPTWYWMQMFLSVSLLILADYLRIIINWKNWDLPTAYILMKGIMWI